MHSHILSDDINHKRIVLLPPKAKKTYKSDRLKSYCSADLEGGRDLFMR